MNFLDVYFVFQQMSVFLASLHLEFTDFNLKAVKEESV